MFCCERGGELADVVVLGADLVGDEGLATSMVLGGSKRHVGGMGVYLASSSSKKALPKSAEKSSRVLFAESRTRTWQAKNVS